MGIYRPEITIEPIQRVYKGWGYEEIYHNDELYCGKKLHFFLGKKCSFHYHKTKTETFYIASGKLRVWYSINDAYPIGDPNLDSLGIVDLKQGETFFVPPGLRHQMKGLLETDVFEFSSQDFPEDTYRIIKGD
jgi:mannose-6-phosphate isomerase-like protein (cupin superfamily)